MPVIWRRGPNALVYVHKAFHDKGLETAANDPSGIFYNRAVQRRSTDGMKVTSHMWT